MIDDGILSPALPLRGSLELTEVAEIIHSTSPASAGWHFDLNSPLRNSDQELCDSVRSVRDKKESFDQSCHQTVARKINK